MTKLAKNVNSFSFEQLAPSHCCPKVMIHTGNVKGKLPGYCWKSGKYKSILSSDFIFEAHFMP